MADLKGVFLLCKANRWAVKWLTTLFLLLTCYEACLAYEEENLVHFQSFSAQVGSGNFTYFKLTLDGCVVLRLESLAGDADLYVSSSSLKPTWEAYDFKATTCGVDEITILPTQIRPVGIGVYGYIIEEINTFHMSVFVDPTYTDPYPEPQDSDKFTTSHDEKLPPVSSSTSPNQSDDEEESLLWTIFVGFLKILFDVLL